MLERDSLFAITPLFKYWLKHYHYDIFQPIWVSKNGIEISENVGLLYKFHTNDLSEIETIYINMETVANLINLNCSSQYAKARCPYHIWSFKLRLAYIILLTST